MTTTTKKTTRRAAAPKLARAKTPVLAETPFVDPAERRAKVAQAAYLLAEQRGFAPGHEEQDWLAAERLVDANG